MQPNRYPRYQKGRGYVGKSRDKYKNRSKSPSYYIQQAQNHGYGVPPPPSFYGVQNPSGYSMNRPKANTMHGTGYSYNMPAQSRQYTNQTNNYQYPAQMTGNYQGNYGYNLQGYGGGGVYSNNNNSNRFGQNLNAPRAPAYSQNSSNHSSQRNVNTLDAISNNLNIHRSGSQKKDLVYKPTHGGNYTYNRSKNYQGYGNLSFLFFLSTIF